MRKFKTEQMYIGSRLCSVNDVVDEAMETDDVSVVNSLLTYLLAHAFDTQDACLRQTCDSIKTSHKLRPFSSMAASDYNIPGIQDIGSRQEQARNRMAHYQERQVTFADRVKSIIQKAASQNGQKIETKAKGHAGAYIFRIDADAFCKAMDDLVDHYKEQLLEFLGGTLNCVYVTKVCTFIGHVIRMNVINDSTLQMTDLLFAFTDYYDNALTVKAKLGDKKANQDQDLFFGTFEGLLKKYKV